MTSTLKWAKICPPWRGSLQRVVTVPRPDKACKELLKRVNVTLPEVLPYRETHVATRKKLNSFRKRK